MEYSDYWEYKFESILFTRTAAEVGVENMMNELGKQRWELVDTCLIADYLYLTFKRKIENEVIVNENRRLYEEYIANNPTEDDE